MRGDFPFVISPGCMALYEFHADFLGRPGGQLSLMITGTPSRTELAGALAPVVVMVPVFYRMDKLRYSFMIWIRNSSGEILGGGEGLYAGQ